MDPYLSKASRGSLDPVSSMHKGRGLYSVPCPAYAIKDIGEESEEIEDHGKEKLHCGFLQEFLCFGLLLLVVS